MAENTIFMRHRLSDREATVHCSIFYCAAAPYEPSKCFGSIMYAWKKVQVTLAFILTGMIATGCGLGTEQLAPARNPSVLLQQLQFEYHAYNLSLVAPYNAVMLNVHGISGAGTPVDAPVTYTYDPDYLEVTADGQLTAKAPVARTVVKAAMSLNGATQTDSAVVSIVASSPALLRNVAIAVNPGDSAKSAYPAGLSRLSTSLKSKALQLIRTDSNHLSSTVLVWVESSDTSVASILQSGNSNILSVTPKFPGVTMLRVSTYAYGVGFRDSLQFLVGWPIGGLIGSIDRFEVGTHNRVVDFLISPMIVGVGACISWVNYVGDMDMDVVFDDSIHVAPPDSASTLVANVCKRITPQDTTDEGRLRGGNIVPWRATDARDALTMLATGQRVRVFSRPGIYRYRSALYGTHGTIVVCDETRDRTCSPEFNTWESLK